ncbi:MAG: hypothetical protein Q8O72_05800 [Bacteroidales bacterium]|nr:hypothetical protein [Bacteroidales bacterium]
MLVIQDIRSRYLKFKQNRYGLSVVFGLPIPNNLSFYIQDIKQTCQLFFPNCFDWYENEKIHSTLIRCKSTSNKIPYDLFENHPFRNNIKSIKEFEMTTDDLIISHDGAIRLFFSSNRLPLPIEMDDISKFEKDLNINLRLVQKPWITLANMKPIQKKIDCVNNNLSSFSNDFLKQFFSIKVESLNAVYFEDTGYREFKILDVIKLL